MYVCLYIYHSHLEVSQFSIKKKKNTVRQKVRCT